MAPYHNLFHSPNSIQQSACLQSSLIFFFFFSYMHPVMLLASGVWRSGCPSPVSGVFLQTSRGGAAKDSVLSPWKRFKQFHRVCSRRSSVTRKREETDLEWILQAKKNTQSFERADQHSSFSFFLFFKFYLFIFCQVGKNHHCLHPLSVFGFNYFSKGRIFFRLGFGWWGKLRLRWAVINSVETSMTCWHAGTRSTPSKKKIRKEIVSLY